MTKAALESAIASLEMWIQVFAVLVAVGIVGEVGFGVRHWILSRRLKAVQHAEDLNQEQNIAKLNKEAGDARQDAAQALERAAKAEESLGNAKKDAAIALERAADANRIAESERLARVKIEDRLAWRRISPEQDRKLVAALTPYAGSAIIIEAINGDIEAETFAKDIVGVLQKAHWKVELHIAGIRIPAPYGLRCRINPESPTAKTLAEALKLLPGSTSEPAAIPGYAAILTVGLKPPP